MSRLSRSVWLLVSGCLLVLTLLATRASCQQTRANVAPIIAALQRHDYAGALTLSQSILQRSPADYRVWTLEGMARAGGGNIQQALVAYQHALSLSPTYLPALEGAAQIEFQSRRPEARTLLVKILAQRPEDETTHMLLGTLDYRTSHCTEAVEHFKRAEHVIQSHGEALTENGVCLSELKRTDDAVVVFKKALDTEPEQRDARYNLALAQWEDHKPEDALETLKPLVEIDPVSSDALALSAEILESKQDTIDAVALLRKALTIDPRNVDAYLYFASLSFDHASPQVGIEILNSGLTQIPKESRLYLVRGILLTQLGEFTRAAEDFEAANRINPKLKFLDVARGLVGSQQHNPGVALSEFRSALKLHPNDPYAHYLLAEALDGEGNPVASPGYNEEIIAAKTAVRLDPKLVAARDLLSSIYLESGQIESAVEESRTALEIDPEDQQAVFHLIVALRKTNQKEQIPQLLKRLMELRSSSADERPKRYRLTLGQDSYKTQDR